MFSFSGHKRASRPDDYLSARVKTPKMLLKQLGSRPIICFTGRMGVAPFMASKQREQRNRAAFWKECKWAKGGNLDVDQWL